MLREYLREIVHSAMTAEAVIQRINLAHGVARIEEPKTELTQGNASHLEMGKYEGMEPLTKMSTS